MTVEKDFGLPLVPSGNALEPGDFPQLDALFDDLSAMKANPNAPDPDEKLVVELGALRGKFSVGDHHTFVTRPARTGPGADRCPCCRRPY
jgi:hypothetical protein